MEKSNAELLEVFYQSHKEDFPDVSEEEFKKVCTYPWLYTKRQMETGLLPAIRLQYFGVFQVYKGRAKFMLKNIEERFSAGKMLEKQYIKLKTMLKNYLNEI